MAQQKLNATVQIGSVLERSVKKNIGVLRSGLEGVGKEIKGVTDRQKELSKQRKVLEKQGRSVEALDREYEDLSRTLDTLRRKQERWTRAAQASQRVGKDFKRMTGDMTRVARNAGIAVAAVGTAIFGLASSTAALGDDVAKSADKLGIGVEAFQELRYAAERSGVPIATFDSSMTAFVKRLGEAKEGTGPAADAIKALGLNVRDLLEMKPEDALGKIAERMKDVKNPAERAAIASDLFSRAGVGMVNMLRDGEKGLVDLRKQARNTGYVLSEKTARDAEVFQDRLLDAQLTVKGLKNVIGAEFMPVVTRSMETFSAWAQENRADVQAFAKTAVESLERAIPVIGEVASGMGTVASKVGEVTAKVADMVGGWDNFGVVLGAVFASKAILSVGRFVWSVGRLGAAMIALAPSLPVVAGGIKAIGLALAANPIGLAVTAIAGGAILVYKYWEPISGFFKRLWGKVKADFDLGMERVGIVIEAFSKVSSITEAWDVVKAGVGWALDVIGQKFEAARTVVVGAMDAFADTLGIRRQWNAFKAGVGFVVDWIGDKFAAARVWVGETITAFGDVTGITEAWQSVKAGLGAVIDWIGAKFDWVLEKIKPVIDALKWVRDKAGAALEKVGIGGGGPQPAALGSADRPFPKGHPMHRPQKRATGGSFRRGWRKVGEWGPELEFTNRSGFIATNRAAERIASLAKGARADMTSAMSGAGGGAAAASVTNHIQINAGGMSPQLIIDELERRMRDASSGALYDGARGYGQYGGAA